MKKVLQAYEGVLDTAKEKEKLHALSTGYSDHADAERLAIKRMTDALKRDGFEVLDGRIVTGLGLPALDDIKETAAEFDARHLTEQIRRIEQAVDRTLHWLSVPQRNWWKPAVGRFSTNAVNQ